MVTMFCVFGYTLEVVRVVSTVCDVSEFCTLLFISVVGSRAQATLYHKLSICTG